LDWASVLSKLDSNTPKITHFGPEKSYLRTRLRDFWPKKYYSRTRKSEIFALKNPIFRTILGWSFTGPRGIDSRHNFAANLTISRSSSGGKNGEECELALALSTWWAVAEKLQN
jgi:hypothetical protein